MQFSWNFLSDRVNAIFPIIYRQKLCNFVKIITQTKTCQSIENYPQPVYLSPLLFNYVCFRLLSFNSVWLFDKVLCKRIVKQKPTLINKQMTVEIVYCSVQSQLNEINVIKRQILSLRAEESCRRTKVSEPLALFDH